MVYSLDLFKSLTKTPYFYSNFVSTIDGKVQVSAKNAKLYWPIGSPLDYETMLWLRAHADVLIHGKNTALGFDTLQTLAKKEFKDKRKILKKKKDLIYMVMSNKPTDNVIKSLQNSPNGIKSILVTHKEAKITHLSFLRKQESEFPIKLASHKMGRSGSGMTENDGFQILRIGRDAVDLHALTYYFKKNNLQKILIEGGPTLMASFVKENLLDEMFVTIAPKLFGNFDNFSKSMVEGYLFPPDKILQFELVSVKKVNSELYLRYRFIKSML